MYFRWRAGPRCFSVGDPHASQGDSELWRHRHRMLIDGPFQLILHKRDRLAGTAWPISTIRAETQDEWVVHGFSFPTDG